MPFKYRAPIAALAMLLGGLVHAADDDIYTFLQADRFEYAEDADAFIWDLQGWVGDDYRKLWAKAEGEYGDGEFEESEIQLLYSRAWTPFFDWQAGIRYDIEPTPSRAHIVFGLQGLAPQWFEVDSALFLSEDGDLSARLELEYDLLLTQRLVLQPRLEVEASASDLPEIGIGSGIGKSELGLRLRYEFRRKFAPYLGINWTKLHGETADLAASNGGDRDDLSVLLGLRLWF
jgi:copper resistance protein B